MDSSRDQLPSHFVGREAEIQELREKLQDHKIVKLTGDIGVGKKTLANAYVNKFKTQYDLTFTISDVINTNSILYYYFQQIGLPVKTNKDIAMMLHTAPVRSLFIVRDIGEVEKIYQELFPLVMEPVDKHHILFIDNVPEFLKYQPHEMLINPLSNEDSKELLNKTATFDKTSEDDVDKLVEFSKGSPLLLEQINGYFNVNKTASVQEFIDKYQSQEKSTYEITKEIVSDKLKSILTTENRQEYFGFLSQFDDLAIELEWLDCPVFTSEDKSISKDLLKDLLDSQILSSITKKSIKFSRDVQRIARELASTVESDRNQQLFTSAAIVLFQTIPDEPGLATFSSHVIHFMVQIIPQSKNLNPLVLGPLYVSLSEILILLYGLRTHSHYLAEKAYKLLPQLGNGGEFADFELILKAQILKQYGTSVANFQEQPNFEDSIEYLKQSKEIYNEIGNNQFDAYLDLHIGFGYIQLKDYQNAMEFTAKSIEETPEDQPDFIKATANICICFIELGGADNIKKCIKYAEATLPYVQENVSISALEILNTLIISHSYLEQPKKVEKYKKLLNQLVDANNIPKDLMAGIEKEMQETIISLKEKDRTSKNQLSLVSTPVKVAVSSAFILGCAYVAFKFLSSRK